MQEMNLILINDRFFHSAKKKKKKKGQVLSSFLTIDIVGPGNLRGIFFFFFFYRKENLIHFIFTSEFMYSKFFCFLLLFFILFYFMEVGLFVRFTLKCHNNRTRRNFRFTYCLYATYCRK